MADTDVRRRTSNQAVRWFPTARALRAIGMYVPSHVADDEALICVNETVAP